jgi:PAS domain S-box-containing protein
VHSATAIQFRQLRHMIAAMMLLAVLFGGLTLLLHVLDEVGEDAEVRAQYNDRLARGLAAHAGTIIGEVDSTLLRTIRRLPHDWQADRARLQMLLRDGVNASPSLRNIVIADAGGVILADAQGRAQSGMSVADRDYFRVHAGARDNHLYIAQPLRSRFDDGVVQVMSRPVRDPDGNLIGAVAGLIDPARFSTLEDGFDLGLGSRIALLGQDGAIHYLNGNGNDPSLLGRVESSLQPYLQARTIQRLRSDRLFDEVERDYAIYPLAGYGLSLVVGIPPRTMASLISQTVEGLVAGLGLLIALTVGMGLTFYWFLRRSETAIVTAERREQQFHDVARSVPGMLYQWCCTDPRHGRFTWVGDGCRDLFGLEPDVFIERQNAFRLHPDDRQRWLDSMHAAISMGSAWNFEGRFILHDGSERRLHTVAGAFVEMNGVHVQNGVALDVTEERQREMNLANTEGRLEMLLDTARDAIISLDDKLHVTHFNKGAEMLFGRSAAEMIGNTLQPLLPADFHDRHDVLMRRMLAGPDGSREMSSWRRVNGVRADGGVFPLLASISKITVLGKPMLCAIMRDMSDEAESERSLTALAEERQRLLVLAEQANAAKARFLAVMSHELRTPLNAIIGFAEVMQQKIMGPIAPPQYGEYVNDILLSGRHLLTIINDILDLTKLQEHAGDFRLEAVDPNEAIDDAITFVKARATEKKIDIAVADQTDGALLQADQRALRQMLINLLGNAVKFTLPGGRIDIVMRRQADADRLAIEVNDNGPGVSAALLARLGKPFVQDRDSYTADNPGTGLGLAIVVELAAAHHGSVSFRNRPEGGFCAALDLPVAAATARAA